MANPEQQGLKPKTRVRGRCDQTEPKWLIQNNKDWNLQINKTGRKKMGEPKWLIQNNKDWNLIQRLFLLCRVFAEMANPEQQGLKQTTSPLPSLVVLLPKWLIQNNKDWNAKLEGKYKRDNLRRNG